MTNQTPKIASLTMARMSLADLKPHPRNPRRHPAPGSPAWNTLRRSLQNAYWDPIIWNRRNGCMVGGHLRQRILLEDGYTQADVSVVDLDEDTHYAVMIAANKAIGDDDEQAVKDLLNELASGGFDMSLTGYDDDELGDILAGPDQDQEAADKVVVDKAAELQAKWGTAEGQLWVMGSHRILCGSCTDPKNWALLMRGEKATLCNTDPPCGAGSWWICGGVRSSSLSSTARPLSPFGRPCSAWAESPPLLTPCRGFLTSLRCHRGGTTTDETPQSARFPLGKA